MKRFVLPLVAVFLVASTAVASEHRRPPDTVLKRGSHRQKGNLASYCWSWSDGEGSGAAQCVDSAGYDWPRAKTVQAGLPARVTIKYPEMPDDGTLTYWRRLYKNGYPKGESHELEYTLEERETSDGTVWDVKFELPDEGHFYLTSFFKWDPGDASYAYHLILE